MRARNDFVNVKLTAAGEAQVGEDGVLRIANRHLHYTFRPGESQEVVRAYEWQKVLRHELTHNGEALFELIEDTASPELEAAVPTEAVNNSEDEEVSANGSV